MLPDRSLSHRPCPSLSIWPLDFLIPENHPIISKTIFRELLMRKCEPLVTYHEEALSNSHIDDQIRR
jgi:hypothetical protein